MTLTADPEMTAVMAGAHLPRPVRAEGGQRVRVRVVSPDSITCAGLVAQLRTNPQLWVVDEDHAGGAEVALVAVERVDDEAVRQVRHPLPPRGPTGLTQPSTLAPAVARREPPWLSDFNNLAHEWRRLFGEVFGTFLLVLAAAGGEVVNQVSGGEIARSGHLSAVAVGAYIALAGLWASPISGAAMNPARAFGPALIRGDITHLWLYVAGPMLGAVGAVGIAWILRGPGGDPSAEKAAQGDAR